VADLPSTPLCRINPADDNKTIFIVLLDHFAHVANEFSRAGPRSSTCLLDRFLAATLKHGAGKRNIFVELRAKWNLKRRNPLTTSPAVEESFEIERKHRLENMADCWLRNSNLVPREAAIFLVSDRDRDRWIIRLSGNVVSVFFVRVGSQVSPSRTKKDSNIPSPGRTRSVKCPTPGPTKTIKSPPHAPPPPPPPSLPAWHW